MNPAPVKQLRLWDGPAPGAPMNPGPEIAEPNGRVSNVSVPMLDVYLPDPAKATGMAILICSGGGYSRLASGPLGSGAAARFLPEGIAVFSLKYRLRPPSDDILRDAVADGKRAMQIIRSHAAEWRLNPGNIGMVGFSAGSNLILNLVCCSNGGNPASNDPIDRVSGRPDFIGICATWSGGQSISGFKIDSTVPPAWIGHAKNDTTARPLFAEQVAAAWKKAGVPVHLQSYETGGHMAFNFPNPSASNWPDNFLAWLKVARKAVH